MTVKELIELLKQHNKDRKVVFFDVGGSYSSGLALEEAVDKDDTLCLVFYPIKSK